MSEGWPGGGTVASWWDELGEMADCLKELEERRDFRVWRSVSKVVRVVRRVACASYELR